MLARRKPSKPKSIQPARLEDVVAQRELGGRGTATVERLRRAGQDWDISQSGVQRVSDSPLSRLRSRGLLSRDSDVNERLAEAGETYYRDYYVSRMDPTKARDYRQPRSEAHEIGVPSIFTAEHIARARIRYRRAVAALGPYFSAVVDAVVLEEWTLESAGASVSNRLPGKPAAAVAMDRLQEGLKRLAEHYGIMRRGA